MAALPVEFHPDALEEAREGHRWYAQRNPSAAERFLAELDRAVAEIGGSPSRWPTHLHGTRRFVLRRFPYIIVYRATPDRVEVIACQHARRRPGYWRERMT